jgi:hypothetical protein
MYNAVLIINFNRVQLPARLADWVAARGCEPIFIDNNSDYPPLLQYYADTPFRVMRMNNNYGHTVVWDLHIAQALKITGRYIVTDPDLDLAGVPDDFLKVMGAGLDKYPQYDKCGLSLEVNDLPDTPEGIQVRTQFEAKMWTKPLDEQYFEAPTDTTFAMYREGVYHYGHNAIRTNRPYTCKHVPWYYKDLKSLPADEQYYFTTANGSSSGKKRLVI